MKLFAKIEFVSGAPVLVTEQVINAGTSPVTVNPSQGFESLLDLSSGTIKLTFGSANGGTPIYDPYVRLLNVTGSLVSATSSFLSLSVGAEDVAGTSGNPSVTFSIACDNGGGPNIQFPTDGSVLLVEVTLSNTTAL